MHRANFMAAALWLDRFQSWRGPASPGRAALQRRLHCRRTNCSSFVVWRNLGRQPKGWLYPVYANSELVLLYNRDECRAEANVIAER